MKEKVRSLKHNNIVRSMNCGQKKKYRQIIDRDEPSLRRHDHMAIVKNQGKIIYLYIINASLC